MSLEHLTLTRAAAPARSTAVRPRAGLKGTPSHVQLPKPRQAIGQSKLALWLAANELDDFDAVLEEHGIQLLADLQALSLQDLAALGLDAAHADRLWQAAHTEHAPPTGRAEQAVGAAPGKEAATKHKQGRSRGFRDRLPFKRGHKPLRTSEAAPTVRFQKASKRQELTAIISSPGAATPVATYDRDRCPDTGKLRSLCHCTQCQNPDASSVQEQQDSAWAERKRAERLAEIEALGLSPSTAKSPVQHPARAAGAPPTAAPTGPVWQEVWATDGRMYYWNKITNVTTWDRPAELPEGGGEGGRRRVRRSTPAGGAFAAESRCAGSAADADGRRRRRRRPATEGVAAAAAPAAPAATSGATGRRRRTRAGDAVPTATRAPVMPNPAAPAAHHHLPEGQAQVRRRRKRREPTVGTDRV